MVSESEYGFGISGNSASDCGGGYHGTYAGGGGGGGAFPSLAAPSRPASTPKKTTLEFNSLEVTYHHESRELTVVNAAGAEIKFDAEGLLELKAALRTFNLDSSGTVEYR